MKIKWSKQAEIVLDEVIQYGELTFGTKATTKLILRIEQCCSLLAIYPRMGNFCCMRVETIPPNKKIF